MVGALVMLLVVVGIQAAAYAVGYRHGYDLGRADALITEARQARRREAR